eukprot:8165558-Lingulodinium_polyedra.AAC.1
MEVRFLTHELSWVAHQQLTWLVCTPWCRCRHVPALSGRRAGEPVGPLGLARPGMVVFGARSEVLACPLFLAPPALAVQAHAFPRTSTGVLLLLL